MPQTPFKAQQVNAESLEHLAMIRQQYQPQQIRVLQSPGAELSKAVLLGDSFLNTLSVFLAEHFAQTVCLRGTHHSFPAAYLLQSHPQIVMQQFTERFLAGEAPALP